MKLLTENKNLNSDLSNRKKRKRIIKFSTKQFQLKDEDRKLYDVSEGLKP